MPLSTAELKECAKGLSKAVNESQWRDVEALLKKLRDQAEPTEELIRSTKLGKTIGPLRKSNDAAIADLAKTIVKKWKAVVGAEKGSTGKPDARKGIHAAEESASPASKGGSAPAPAAASPAASSSPAPSAVKKDSTDTTSGSGPTRDSATPSKPAQPINFECLQDKVRNACLKLLHQSLEADYRGDKSLVFEAALAVERSCYTVIGKSSTCNEYKSKVRSLSLNLKDKNNPELRKSVVDGRILPDDLVKMSVEDMASDARRQERQRLMIQNLFNARAAEEQQAETDAFECSRCRQRKTRYYQKQTRSADEPMTVFVTCVNCNYRWKFS
ncbi:transcription elongation factor [Tilletiaria anomala UBC 951]|uniref:Transcription elongation factor n=1 Tax=Tilletiaria anomala (strain ATCC 24038 / CBS 436.72 / UBC 951) TaxID=1037660 RepID=A0A066VP37_TILAU|nr:transcription elongation factor [Tilletiaria anomala UBC 951]KDN40534.1 transcription elongation factor [Tilletiaria anomala UBC 951]